MDKGTVEIFLLKYTMLLKFWKLKKKKRFLTKFIEYFYYHYLSYISFINEITWNDYLTIEINTRSIFWSNNPRVGNRPRIEIK